MSHFPHTLWYTRPAHPSPLGLAAQLGWFLDEFVDDGINVFTLEEESDPRLLEGHRDHHRLNSFRQGGSVPAIWARSRGADTRVIGFNWVDEFQAIVTLQASGIVTPADLDARRLALPRSDGPVDWRRAEALRGFSAALGSVGLDTSSARFVDVPIPTPDKTRSLRLTGPTGYDRVIDALEDGRVDAVYIKGSRGLERMHAAGARSVFDIRSQSKIEMRVNHGTPRPITVDAALLREHPDIVVRFLSRVAAVGAWATIHPAETVHYVSRETGSAERWVRGAYGPDLHRQQKTVIDAPCTRALSSYKAFLLEQGFITSDFSVEDWIDPAPLAAALARIEARPAKRFLRAV